MTAPLPPKSNARVLIVNDVANIADMIKDRVFGAGVKKVVVPKTFGDLNRIANDTREPPFALILLDYAYDNWGPDGSHQLLHEILTLLRSAPATRSAHIVMVTVYLKDVRADPLTKNFRAVNYSTAGTAGIEDIIEQHLSD